MSLTRGVCFTHATVREWEARFAPLLTAQLHAKRRGVAGGKWHADETYGKVDGRWCYLYRAIDRDGNLVEAPLSETHDMAAARRFFAQALAVVGHAPEQVTTDGHDAYPRAIREVIGAGTIHRSSRYKNNRIEQDHRGIKQRYSPMRGFGSFASAARFCPCPGRFVCPSALRGSLIRVVETTEDRECPHVAHTSHIHRGCRRVAREVLSDPLMRPVLVEVGDARAAIRGDQVPDGTDCRGARFGWPAPYVSARRVRPPDAVLARTGSSTSTRHPSGRANSTRGPYLTRCATFRCPWSVAAK